MINFVIIIVLLDFGWDYELFLRIGRIIDRFENTLFNNDYSLGCIIEV